MSLIRFEGGPLDQREVEVNHYQLSEGSFYSIFKADDTTPDKDIRKRLKGPYMKPAHFWLGECCYKYKDGRMVFYV